MTGAAWERLRRAAVPSPFRLLAPGEAVGGGSSTDCAKSVRAFPGSEPICLFRRAESNETSGAMVCHVSCALGGPTDPPACNEKQISAVTFQMKLNEAPPRWRLIKELNAVGKKKNSNQDFRGNFKHSLPFTDALETWG